MGSDPLAPEEVSRYARHLTLPEVGIQGQQKLKDSQVLLIGTGGLGAPLGLYLAAAGIGRLGVVDFDRVEQSNLQRQIIHGQSDVGRPKVESARQSILDVNPHVQVDCYDEPFTRENALRIAESYDLLIDGTDNFPTRYLVNDVCVLQGKPNCYGSIYQFEGQASVFNYQDGPCYRCLYPQPPDPGAVPSCAEAGVLGVLPGLIGIIQATEAIKICLGKGDTLSGRLLLYDALEMSFRELKIRRDPDCPVCGQNPSIKELIDYKAFCGVPTSNSSDVPELTVEELKEKLRSRSGWTLLDVREPHEFDICNLDGTLIPLAELSERLHELDASQELVVHCKMGGRSLKAAQLLMKHGFTKVHNLRGGILAWADQIDPQMPRY